MISREAFVGSLLILNKSDEFKIYQDFLREQIVARSKKIVQLDIDNAQGVNMFNFLKGEISGLETAIALPSKAAQVVETDRLLEEAQKEENKENGNG